MISSTSPRVSVIMPVHNAERFIRASIDSVISQTFNNWELLIIDDASTDASMTIAKKYAEKDSRIFVLENKNHIGMPSAPRNTGVRMAKGRFIAFLDSDDMWKPNKLEQQLPLFEDKRTAIVYSNYEKTDQDSITQPERIVKAPQKITYHQMLLGNIIGNLTGIYDTLKVGKIPIENVHHEDYVMWLAILKKGYIGKNTNTVSAIYRTHGGSVSANKWNVLSWQWYIYRHVENISFVKSIYYYANYAFRAFLKALI